jgi:uncharacterized protein YdeI (YjbR/CyaY-like superfamily)
VKAPDPGDVHVFASPGELREWLEEHHATEREAWIGYYRKGVPKTSIRYAEAVDEALCFGWIDGIGYRIGDEVYANRFTPRQRRSTWSQANVRRVGELMSAGRMRPAGIAAFERRSPERTGVYSYENRPDDLPEPYRAQLQADSAAWGWWRAQTPSYRRAATWWVISPKREATRARHLAALVTDCAAGRIIKPFTYGMRDAASLVR